MAILIVLLALAQQQPSTDRIDYAHPEKYVDFPKTLGEEARIRRVAEPLKGKSAEQSLRAIGRWMDCNLKCDPDKAYKWRDVGLIMDDGKYGGCADHALVFGSLARARGIPTD